MKIGVFGGTFDPPHLAHIAIAEKARDGVQLDRVLFLPAPRPPHKTDHVLTEYRHRVDMLRRAIRGHSGFELSEIETRFEGPSYTTQTLDFLAKENKNAEWFLIIGADSLRDLHTWRDPKRLCRQAKFIVYPRAGCDLSHVDPLFLANMELLDVPHLDLSSTHVRDQAREGRDICDIVPDAVAQYIKANHLYDVT